VNINIFLISISAVRIKIISKEKKLIFLWINAVIYASVNAININKNKNYYIH
jgi:hypothetical protein